MRERFPGEIEQLLGKLDLGRKVRLLTGASVWRTHAEPEIGLRAIVFSDGPAGVRGPGWDEREPSLTLPCPTAVGATWDEGLVYRLGRLLAAEARRKGVDVLLAPTLNLQRSPYGGRHFEFYSEDPVLAGRVGAALIRGLQDGGVAATAKHYVANESETQRMTLDALVDEATLREVYLAPFELAVTAGVWLVMSAYNGVNGASMSQSPLLAEPLKGEWGFTGTVVSDWGAVRETVRSAKAAQDLAMPGPGGPWGDRLVEAVRTGQVPEAAVDEKVRRLLRLADRVGALDPVSRPAPASSPEDRALLRETAAKSIVLLRNENSVLPLDPGKLSRIAVLGPNAAATRIQGGGSAEVFPVARVSPVDGIERALAGRAEVLHAVGVRPSNRPTPLDTGTDPRTGEPGVLVRLLDERGTEIHVEHRLTGRILEPADVAGAAAVEVRALLTPDRPGMWRIAVAGWGRVTLEVGGETVLDERIAVDVDDPATIHLAPPFRSVGVELTAGQPVELTARRTLESGTGRAVVLAADPPHPDEGTEFARAVALARDSDAAVVVVGTTEEIESEGFDRPSLALPGRQDELVRAVLAANPNTVVVVGSGAPVLLPWRESVPAILLGWFGGEEIGNALADVLFGHTEPGGRLPTTWPAGESGLPGVTPDAGVLVYKEGPEFGYRAPAGAEAAYVFGHGLGYTSWGYETIEATPDGVRVGLRNTGRRAGSEVVQAYLSHVDGQRRLAGYAVVQGEPGQRVTAEIPIPARAFQRWVGGWRTEPGDYAVDVGRSSGDLRLSISITK